MITKYSEYRRGLEFIIREFGIDEVISGEKFIFIFPAIPINKWRTSGYTRILSISERWLLESGSSSDDNIYFKYKL